MITTMFVVVLFRGAGEALARSPMTTKGIDDDDDIDDNVLILMIIY